MGSFQRRVFDTMEKVERFLEETAGISDEPDKSEISFLLLRGELLQNTLRDLSEEAKTLQEEAEDTVQKSLCLQLQSVLATEAGGLERVLAALKTADKAKRLSAEAEIRRETERIRKKLWKTENEN